MVHQTFINIAILPLLAVIIISSHKVVGQQPTYYPTYWPTSAPTAADAEYGQEKSVQDETWIDWGKWGAVLKDWISGGGGEGGNDDNGDRSIGGWPTYYPTSYEPTAMEQTLPSPTYEPTSYEPTAMEQTLQYDRPPPKASNTGVNNAYGVTVTLVAAIIVSVTFLFVS